MSKLLSVLVSAQVEEGGLWVGASESNVNWEVMTNYRVFGAFDSQGLLTHSSHALASLSRLTARLGSHCPVLSRCIISHIHRHHHHPAPLQIPPKAQSATTKYPSLPQG